MAKSMQQIMQTAEIIPGGFWDQSVCTHTTRTTKREGMTTEELSPLVKPGEYQLVYVGRYTCYLHGKRPKLAVKFRIVDPGEYFEKELERWYNCKRLISKPGNNGRFVPPRHGDFLLEYTTLFPTVLTRNCRLDRISFTPFKSCVVSGRVDTVTRNSKQRGLPEVLQYSTIRELRKVGA